MPDQNSHKFKVIIIGGGPTGMLMGHAFIAAGVDFTLLEGQDAFESYNPGLVALWPNTLRLLNQMGLLDEVIAARSEGHAKSAWSTKGQKLWETPLISAVTEWLGIPPMVVQRGRLMNLLSKDLKGKPNVHLSKRVNAVHDLPNGKVQVTCADGTIFDGSIVLGADGPWSVVRTHITQARRSRNLPMDPEKPFETWSTGTFCLSKHSEVTRKLPKHVFLETRGKNLQMSLLADEEELNYALFRTLPATSRERKRFTQQDVDELFDEFADHLFIEGVTVKDLRATKFYNWMTNIEEGRVHHWYSGRMVLVGDSTHKMTPQAGFGFNAGAQGVAELANQLHALLAREGQQPREASLEAAFSEYQEGMRKHEGKFNELSAAYARQIHHRMWGFDFVDRYILPWIGGDKYIIKYLVVPTISEGRVFQFLEEEGWKDGSVPWKVRSPVVRDDKNTA